MSGVFIYRSSGKKSVPSDIRGRSVTFPQDCSEILRFQNLVSRAVADPKFHNPVFRRALTYVFGDQSTDLTCLRTIFEGRDDLLDILPNSRQASVRFQETTLKSKLKAGFHAQIKVISFTRSYSVFQRNPVLTRYWFSRP